MKKTWRDYLSPWVWPILAYLATVWAALLGRPIISGVDFVGPTNLLMPPRLLIVGCRFRPAAATAPDESCLTSLELNA